MRLSWRDRRWARVAVMLGATSLLAPGCRDDETSPMEDDDAGGTEGTDEGTGDDVGDDNDDDSLPDDDADPDDESDGGTDDDGAEDVVPAPGGLRRLLGHQYIASVQYLLGPDAAAVATPPEDPSLGGFDSLAAAESAPSPADVENYEESAQDIAAAVVADPGYLAQTVPCIEDAQDEACYTTLATTFGRLAWRRPLSDDQVATLVDVGLFAQEWDDGDFMTGVEYMLTAMLQSPNFIYLVEVGDETDDVDHRVLDQYELAARMSFFLLGRTTDAVTLAKAEAGELGTPDEIKTLAWDLVDSGDARTTVRGFYDEYLRLRELPNKGKDDKLFPLFTPELGEAMRQETLLLVEDMVFEKDTDVLQLLDANYTWVNEDLAALYGVEPPAPGTWTDREFPEGQGRAGVLSQAGWLSVTAHNEVNSPTRRGLFISEEILCTEVPPVPPEVNPEPIVPMPGQTLREALSIHMEEPSCASCHALTDPLGFAFEFYSPIGEYRTTDNGGDVDASGDIDGLGSWETAAELAALLRQDARTSQCLVNQVYKHGLGFAAGVDQAQGLFAVEEEFAASEHNLKALLVELIASPLFRWVDAPK